MERIVLCALGAASSHISSSVRAFLTPNPAKPNSLRSTYHCLRCHKSRNGLRAFSKHLCGSPPAGGCEAPAAFDHSAASVPTLPAVPPPPTNPPPPNEHRPFEHLNYDDHGVETNYIVRQDWNPSNADAPTESDGDDDDDGDADATDSENDELSSMDESASDAAAPPLEPIGTSPAICTRSLQSWMDSKCANHFKTVLSMITRYNMTRTLRAVRNASLELFPSFERFTHHRAVSSRTHEGHVADTSEFVQKRAPQLPPIDEGAEEGL